MKTVAVLALTTCFAVMPSFNELPRNQNGFGGRRRLAFRHQLMVLCTIIPLSMVVLFLCFESVNISPPAPFTPQTLPHQNDSHTRDDHITVAGEWWVPIDLCSVLLVNRCARWIRSIYQRCKGLSEYDRP